MQLYMELLIQEAIVCKAQLLACIVCSYLPRSGSMSPEKFSKIKCNEIEFRGNFKIISMLLAITMKYYSNLATESISLQ